MKRPAPLRPVAALMDAGVRAGAFPGGVVAVWDAERLRHLSAHGTLGRPALGARWARKVTPRTRYDLASLTKPLCTALAAMRLHARGRLALDAEVGELLPTFVRHARGRELARRRRVRVWHLLAHASGLPAHRPYYTALDPSRSCPEQLLARVAREPLEREPGERACYSDLGFILLGALLERLAGRPLAAQVTPLYRELGLTTLDFARAGAPLAGAAPTEHCPWRGRLLAGEVHDEHAHLLGGSAGHAGLFGAAEDVGRLALELCRAARGESPHLPLGTVAAFFTRPAVPGSTWALGWDGPAPRGSSAGRRMDRLALGHLGFTGTSLWMDLARGLVVVLLTNRVHPTRDNTRIRRFRPRLHDTALAALDGDGPSSWS